MPQPSPPYRTIAYYVDWAVYDRQHYPTDLPLDNLTHVLYAFAQVNADTGEVTLSDTYADLQKPLPPCTICSTSLTGAIPSFTHLRDVHYSHLKLLLSIGGGNATPAFTSAASIPARRQTFASSALALIQKLGLDGVDVDWEYPSSAEEGANFLALMQALRAALDAASSSRQSGGKGNFVLTIAAPAATWAAQYMSLAETARVVDWFNVMAYDFAGPWSQHTGHASNLFAGTEQQGCEWSVQQALDMYIAAGVPKGKIVVGCPLYGRQFVGTTGVGGVYSGVGEKGSWEKGVWDWRDLPLQEGESENGGGLVRGGPGTGGNVQVDQKLGASWQYARDYEKGTFVTWDSMDIAKMKGQWVKNQGLGGVMWWESSGDGKKAEGSVIETVADILNGS